MFLWSLSKNSFGFGVLLSSTFRICNKIFLVKLVKPVRLYSLQDFVSQKKFIADSESTQ